MKAVIHRGKNYEKSLRAFQNKRMEYIERELRTFDPSTLWSLLCTLQEQGRTLAQITGLGVQSRVVGVCTV
jgi:hypothetical protein